MSAVPAEIAGIGSTQQKLRVSPSFDPLKAAVDPQEYFVLSRIDGTHTLRDVLLTTGLPVDRAIAIVQRLRAIGALLVPGEIEAPAAEALVEPHRPPAPAPRSRRSGAIPVIQPDAIPELPTTRSPRSGAIPAGGRLDGVPAEPMWSRSSGAMPAIRPDATPAELPTTRSRSSGAMPAIRPDAAAAEPPPSPPRRASSPPAPDTAGADPEHDLSLPGATASELAALREDIALADRTRRLVLAIARLADGRDPWALLGVPPGADPLQLRRAYFKLSKEIHPDRHYGQRLGSFADRLPFVFEAMSRAYARLTGPERRAGTAELDRAEQPQTPQEYAGELFERACQLELGGNHLDAMRLFAAAVRVDPQPRYLRRAASCALAAGQPRSAVEYAKKAHSRSPNDPSAARLLAAAFRAAGNLLAAEELLIMAMALKSENDVLAAELRNDLAQVRRLLAQS